MKDFETIKLDDALTMHQYFDEQEKNDIWKDVYTNELEAIPIEDNELLLLTPEAFRTNLRNGVSADFSPLVDMEDILSTMKTTKTGIAFPLSKMEMFPLRYTAWTHLQKRAGLEGRSINSLKDRARQKELSPAKRCEMLNDCLSLYTDKTKVLVRDGKVTALMSGDESDYAVMPVIRLINILETELQAQYSHFSFASAKTCHEITEVSYVLKDQDLEKGILSILSSNGLNIGKVDVHVQLTTSDVGNCAARLTPVVKIDGRQIPIGKSSAVEHKGGSKAMALYVDMVHLFLAKYRENIENINDLMKIRIEYPSSCLSNIVKKIGLVGYNRVLGKAKETLEQSFRSCTAYDLYFVLCNMLYDQEQLCLSEHKEINLYTSIKAQETVAEVLFLDFKDFDYMSTTR